MQSLLKNTLKISTAFTVVLLLCGATTLQAQTIDWIRQLGTSSGDASYGVSVDGLGNVYISGYSSGDLGGINAGSSDAFIAKYTSDGVLDWARQLGSSSFDVSNGVSADGLGNVYISGSTSGDLSGSNAGVGDAFITKFDSDGALAWTRQLGTSSNDVSLGVSADGLGGIYISGFTQGGLEGGNVGGSDTFIAKYTSDGVLAWTKQLGTSSYDDQSPGLSADGLGNVYLTSYSWRPLLDTSAGTTDVSITKYTSDGTLAWTKQLASSSEDYSTSVSADGLGNLYLSGHTSGDFDGANAGGWDAFVSKYTSDGVLVWTKQLGTSTQDYSYAVSADDFGNVYLSGRTFGNLDGTIAGSSDVFVAKYTSDGLFDWVKQFGTSSSERSNGISADGLGNVFLTGQTSGILGGSYAGNSDAFTVKIIDESFVGVPEPGTAILALFSLGGFLSVRRKHV